jgi:hypothetical protein
MIWAFIAGFVVVLIGVFVLRPWVGRLFHNDFQGIKTEAIVGPIIALTVFLSAFVVAQATGSYQRATQNANAEGSAVALMFENAGLLPDDRGTDLQATSVCYARSVRNLEWPALRKGRTSAITDQWAARFNDEIPPILDGPGAIVGQVVSLNRAQSEARLLRINEADKNLPLLTVIVMIGSILFALLVVATFAVTDMKRGVLLALGFALAFLLGGMLVLVDQLEQPFTGIVRIEPSVISDVAQDTATKFAEAHPGVALPCNAQGRPLS